MFQNYFKNSPDGCVGMFIPKVIVCILVVVFKARGGNKCTSVVDRLFLFPFFSFIYFIVVADIIHYMHMLFVSDVLILFMSSLRYRK